MDSFTTDSYATSSLNAVNSGDGISPPRGQRRDFDMDDLLDNAEPVLEKLTRFWVDERNAPEVLEWQGLVVDEVLNKLHAQVGSPCTFVHSHLAFVPFSLPWECCKYQAQMPAFGHK